MDTLEYGVMAVAVVGIALGLYGALVPNLGRLRLPSLGAGEEEEEEDLPLGALGEGEIRDLEEEIGSLDDGLEGMEAELGPARRARRRGRGIWQAFPLRRRRRFRFDEEDEAEEEDEDQGEDGDEEAGSAFEAETGADVDAEGYEDEEETEDARPAARSEPPQPAVHGAPAESNAAAPAAIEAISPSGTPETDDDLLAIFRDSAQQGDVPAAVRDSLEHVSIQELLAEARAVHALLAGADADEE